MTLLVVFLLLAAAGIFYFAEVQQALAVKANVNLSPQVHFVQQVFHIKGSVSQQGVDVNTETIPIKTLSTSKNGSLSGQTTGQKCIVPFFGCQQAVSQSDVDNLSLQLRQSLDRQITRDLQQQIHNQNGTKVGDIQFTDAAATANPAVGETGNSVTVSITGQQGQAAYILNHDAQDLARQLLKQEAQKLGANYMLLNSLTKVGRPVIKGENSNGDVFIDIAAAGDAEYQFSPDQIQSMQNAVTNKKEKDALVILKRQQGVDPATVTIHLSGGNTMPGDAQDIKIITINPVNFPPVFLPKAMNGGAMNWGAMNWVPT